MKNEKKILEKQKNLLKTKQKYLGFTLIEILTSLGVLIIILSVIVVRFTSNNRLSELKLSADALATDVRYLQTLTMSNQKLVDYGGQVERGYEYNFTQYNRNYVTYVLYSATETGTINEAYYSTTNLYNSKVKIEDILTTSSNDYGVNDQSGKTLASQESNGKLSLKDFLIYPLRMISAKVKATAHPDGGKASKVYYLFPDAETQIYNLYGSGSCTTGTCNTLILYLKHDDISNKRGQVIINRSTGRVTSEIVNYP